MSSHIVKLRNIKRALTSTNSNSSSLFKIAGRVKNFRASKTFNFVDLSDGSTPNHLQVIINKQFLDKPQLGSYLVCTGNLVPSKGPKQPIEFKVQSLDYISKCDPNQFPLASINNPDDLSVSHRKFVHLRPRVPEFASVLRLRSEIELAFHKTMKEMDFFRVHTPSLTGNDSEASTDLFMVSRTQNSNRENVPEPNDLPSDQTNTDNQIKMKESYFGHNVYLTTSAQMHLECLAAELSRVYTLSNAYRAENSQTRRHLCEFLMFEAEESNVDTVEGLMIRVETIIKSVADYLAQSRDPNDDLEKLLSKNDHSDMFDKLSNKGYVRMTYNQALEILRDKTKNFEGDTRHGCDIGRKHEQALLEYCDNVPIFITHYPKSLKPFYMKTMNANSEVVENFDLIAPLGGELCGGSLREDNLEFLTDSLVSHNINKKPHPKDCENDNEHSTSQPDFQWYLDLRRFGSFPHGGFGIGLERLTQSLLGIKNIRDTCAFPRRLGDCPM